MKRKILIAAILGLTAPSVAAEEPAQEGMPAFDRVELQSERNDYEPVPTTQTDRIFRSVSKNNQGNTVNVPLRDIERLCGDQDGCEIRLAMHNWDDKGRVASRQFLFFYNPRNRTWRASPHVGGADAPSVDRDGTDSDNQWAHVGWAWGCYFTDAEYVNSSYSDTVPGFGLLSWPNYNGDCWITLVD